MRLSETFAVFAALVACFIAASSLCAIFAAKASSLNATCARSVSSLANLACSRTASRAFVQSVASSAAFGLLTSADGERWELLPSKAPTVVEAAEEAVATTATRSVEVEVPPKAELGGGDDEGDEEGEDDE